jgi:hypothetical protein
MKISTMIRPLAAILLSATFAAAVAPPSKELRERFGLDDHYQKCVVLDGFPIVASASVKDEAVLETAHIISKMLDGRGDILRALARDKIRFGIMAVTERTCDLPEHSDLTPPAYWNVRARGLGATRERPCVSCGEENVLHNPGDPYSTESILVHEFAHAIHLVGLASVDPEFDSRLNKTYQAALAKGLWKGTYASENKEEYWAEAVQSWFDTNRENDAIHNHVNTREELREYDPALAALCEEVFPDNSWRYIRADHPSRKNESHLKDLDRSKLPAFEWSREELDAYEKVKD